MRKKAFRSLEAYNQIWIITNQIWIITERNRTINCADCLGCNAGLTESCLLIASVLFYLEAWTKVDRKLSCMQLKCPLVLPSSANKVEYSRVRDINFKSAKKMKADLDETIENLNWGTLGFWELRSLLWKLRSKTGGASADASGNRKFDLSKCKTKPVLLSLVPPADSTSKEMSITFTPGSSIICFLDSISSRSCLSRSPATRFSSRPLALSSRLAATSR